MDSTGNALDSGSLVANAGQSESEINLPCSSWSLAHIAYGPWVVYSASLVMAAGSMSLYLVSSVLASSSKVNIFRLKNSLEVDVTFFTSMLPKVSGKAYDPAKICINLNASVANSVTSSPG